jgi:hypothetical protein
VTINLGDGNDTFTTVLDPTLSNDFHFTINGGPAADRIVLVDPTGGGDVISCGSGVDTVVTAAATAVGSDCERVQRVG